MKNSVCFIDKVLDFIVKRLRINHINISSNLNDGRLNSSQNEFEIMETIKNDKEITNYLQKNNLSLISSKAREWYDFALQHKNNKNIFFPINIKVTDLSRNNADNLNVKLGIYFALTGIRPSFDNQIKWKDFFNKLSDDFQETSCDYYFLVINKLNTADIFWNSLKNLSEISAAGNNLSFQCVWNKNRNRNKKVKNYYEAKKMIMNTFEESIKQRAMILIHFQQAFNKKKQEISKKKKKFSIKL